MQSNNIKQYIQSTDFQPEVYLKLCLLKYFQFRTSPNIKLLTLNDTIFVLNYLGCSFDKGDISTFVKLSLRFKNLMRGIPQSIPIDKDQKFDHWYEIFLKKLKSQITEAFNKITSESDENETFIKNYLLSDKSIMRKCISLIERDIIEYSKDNKKSEDNSSESHSVNRISDYIDDNKDGDFSSEDEQPLTKLVAKKKSIDNSSETKIAEDKEKLDRMKSVTVSTIISSLNETENSTKVLDDQPETSHRESSNVGGSNNIELTSNRTGVIENSNSLNSNDQQVSMETANNELISESNPNIDASSSTVEQPHDRQPSQSENIFSNSQTLVLNSDSLVIDTTETVNFLNPTTTCMNDMDNPLISNVISLASDENISIVLDETIETNSGDFNIKPKINPDNETTRKLRSYGDLIKEALNAEITTSEVITLDDDDDDNTIIQTADATNLKVNTDNMQAINENNLQVNTNNEQSNAATNSVVHKRDSGNATEQIHENGMETHESKKTPTASCLQNFIDKQIESMILTNSNIVNLTEEIPENTNAVTVINNEIGENSHSSNDITINTPSSFVIDKQSINSVPFRTFIGKAKTMYRVIKSPFIDEFFDKYCASFGNFSIPSQKLLLSVLCKNFLDINLYKRLEIYTDIVLSIFKFCVENSPELLEFTFETINNNKKLFSDILIQFKSMLKYMLYFCLEKLQIKLKTLQKYTADILITPDDVQDLAISFNVPTEAHFKTLRLISQSNIIDIKHYPLPRQGLTIRQIYNFPGVTVKCQFTDIVFSRTNLSSYKSSVTLSSRKNPVVVNKKLIGDKKLKQLEENEKDVALSTKYLMNYFQSVFGAFQQGEITGVKYLRDVCTEFVKDIVYISPSRKAMVMNSEFHCSLSNYAYVVAPNINVNRICLKHVINPEVKILLSEPDTPDQCYLKLICNLCNIDYDAFDSEQTLKNFSKHLVRVHGYFAEAHTCVYCNKDFSFQELLNKRWMHECYS